MTAVHAALEVEHDQSERPAKGRATFDVLALQQLLAPVRRATARAQRIQLIASAATVVPFVGIVELGRCCSSTGPWMRRECGRSSLW
jgi:ATP-binding cassette subfamily B protein IrtA